MPRGKPSNVGDINISANGYSYTRTETGWRLTHHIIAEEKLGRTIESDETVRFVDGDRNNLSPDNIIVTKRKTSLRGKIARIDAQIMELQAERDRLQKQLDRQNGNHRD